MLRSSNIWHVIVLANFLSISLFIFVNLIPQKKNQDVYCLASDRFFFFASQKSLFLNDDWSVSEGAKKKCALNSWRKINWEPTKDNNNPELPTLGTYYKEIHNFF